MQLEKLKKGRKYYIDFVSRWQGYPSYRGVGEYTGVIHDKEAEFKLKDGLGGFEEEDIQFEIVEASYIVELEARIAALENPLSIFQA